MQWGGEVGRYPAKQKTNQQFNNSTTQRAKGANNSTGRSPQQLNNSTSIHEHLLGVCACADHVDALIQAWGDFMYVLLFMRIAVIYFFF